MAKTSVKPKPLTDEEKLERGGLEKYGKVWPPLPHLICMDKGLPKEARPAIAQFVAQTLQNTPWLVPYWQEFYIEKLLLNPKGSPGWYPHKPEGYLGWKGHFMAMASILFGREDCLRKFTWNPNAVAILDKYEEYNFLGVAGSASSGKSEVGAVIGILEWLIDPFNTKVFFTSTTLNDSRGRIWGVVEEYWKELIKFFVTERNLPGKLVSSQGVIRAVEKGRPNSLAGLALIAGDKSQEKDSTTKIGFKAPRVRLIADELPLLSEGLYNAAKGNLFSNPDFKMMGIGNPASYYDPFGIFTEPKEGWNSIDENSFGWETKLGYCIRFDGTKGPNVIAGRTIWKGLLTLEKVTDYIRTLGENSAEFWRMVRGFWSPTGLSNSIHSEQEIIAHGANKPSVSVVQVLGKLSFLDVAFTQGGDRCVACFGRVIEEQVFDESNRATGTHKALEFTEAVDLMLKVDAKHETKDVSEQLSELYLQACEARGVPLEYRGLDATGGGIPFASLLNIKMGRGFVQVSFAGNASDKPISNTDRRTGEERFTNRVSELWWVFKEYIRGNQIRGLEPTSIKELCARNYVFKGEKIQVETKRDMKKRIAYSPDFADGCVGLLEVARLKFSFVTSEKSAPVPKKSKEKPMFHDLIPKARSGFRRRFQSLGWD